MLRETWRSNVQGGRPIQAEERRLLVLVVTSTLSVLWPARSTIGCRQLASIRLSLKTPSKSHADPLTPDEGGKTTKGLRCRTRQPNCCERKLMYRRPRRRALARGSPLTGCVPKRREIKSSEKSTTVFNPRVVNTGPCAVRDFKQQPARISYTIKCPVGRRLRPIARLRHRRSGPGRTPFPIPPARRVWQSIENLLVSVSGVPATYRDRTEKSLATIVLGRRRHNFPARWRIRARHISDQDPSMNPRRVAALMHFLTARTVNLFPFTE